MFSFNRTKQKPGAVSVAKTPLEQFRARHQSATAMQDWQNAETAIKPMRAFIAIALDPTALDGLDTMLGHLMAREACVYAKTLLEVVPDAERYAAAAAATCVVTATSEWMTKRKLFISPSALDAALASGEPTSLLQAVWIDARRTYPQYDEKTAGICLLAVMELGQKGLARLDLPEIFTVGASRYAAWSFGKRLQTEAPVCVEEAAAALAVVQSLAIGRDEAVLHVPYTGKKGSPSAQALSLARDALLCSHLAEARPDLVPREGAEFWLQAAQRHAYAGIALQPSAFMELSPDAAFELAGHARQFVADIEEQKTRTMPIFPAGCEYGDARSVIASLRRV